MAKLLTPLLSFSASGQLAKSIVAYTWNGINCLRSYVIPRDPKTLAQREQRAAIALATKAWKLYLYRPLSHIGWTNQALQDPRPLTGYNAAISNLTLANRALGNAAFVVSSSWPTNTNLRIYLRSYITGDPYNEGVTFAVHYGDTPQDIPNLINVTQTDGRYINVIFPAPQTAELFFQVSHTVLRSGRQPTGPPP